MKTSNKNVEKHTNYVREITDEYFSAAGDLQIEGANATLILKVDKSKIRYVTFSKMSRSKSVLRLFPKKNIIFHIL